MTREIWGLTYDYTFWLEDPSLSNSAGVRYFVDDILNL